MVWGTKGIGSPPLTILCTFYRQRVSMTSQHAHVMSIWKRVVVVGEGEGSYKLGVFSKGPPLSLFDMLLLIRGGSRTWCSLCGSFLGLLGHRSFHFVFCIPPFGFSVLIYLWLASFHHHHIKAWSNQLPNIHILIRNPTNRWVHFKTTHQLNGCTQNLEMRIH
jgi:hypothetical protein